MRLGLSFVLVRRVPSLLSDNFEGLEYRCTDVDECKFPKVYFRPYSSLNMRHFWLRLGFIYCVARFIFCAMILKVFTRKSFLLRKNLLVLNFYLPPLGVLSVLHKKYSFDCWFGIFFLNAAPFVLHVRCFTLWCSHWKRNSKEFWRGTFSIKF